MYINLVKPFFDFCVAFFAIIILSPLLIVISILILADSKGPVFFRQMRLGKNGKEFCMFKFRSMITDQSNISYTTKLYENDRRITNVGRFLRKTSLDELPQLINILKGEMSFIGPRPPLTYFPKKINEYSDFEAKRFLVKPGISGLSQIRCREIHDWEINIPIDVEYVQNISLRLDAKLFASSLMAFFRTDNVYRKQ